MDNLLAEEEVEMNNHISLLNAYNIYYNKKYNKKGSLLNNNDYNSSSIISDKLATFYEELQKYKKDKNEIYTDRISNKCLKLEIELESPNNLNVTELYYSENIIPLLLKLIENKNWINKYWKIE